MDELQGADCFIHYVFLTWYLFYAHESRSRNLNVPNANRRIATKRVLNIPIVIRANVETTGQPSATR